MGVPEPLLEWGSCTLIEYQMAQLKGPPIDRVVLLDLNQPQQHQEACASYFAPTGGRPPE